MRKRRKVYLVKSTKRRWSPRRKLRLNDIKRKIWRRNRSFILLIADHTA